MQPQTHALIRYLGELLVALVVVIFVGVVGSILGFTLYATGARKLLSVFMGPSYLFFILVGLALGYIVNRRQCSRAAPWIWILPTIWFASWVAGDLSSGIHKGGSLSVYIWDTLILGNHEQALISQLAIGAPALTSLAYSVGAWLAIRCPRPA
jgi:hypothetical protein